MDRMDPNRDALPSFNDQISGVPGYTKRPCGAARNPTHKVNYRDGTTNPLAPWGITVNPKRDKLTMRTMPPTLKRAISTGALQSRPNQAAMSAGNMLANSSSQGALTPPRTPTYMPEEETAPAISPGGDRLRRTVDDANAQATEGYMPTEAEILAGEMPGR